MQIRRNIKHKFSKMMMGDVYERKRKDMVNGGHNGGSSAGIGVFSRRKTVYG